MGGVARVGRTNGQTICGGPRWGRAGWEGLRGLGGLMARPFAEASPKWEFAGTRASPTGDREDSPGLRESVRPMPRVNEVN
jgi:hypothetical protein